MMGVSRSGYYRWFRYKRGVVQSEVELAMEIYSMSTSAVTIAVGYWLSCAAVAGVLVVGRYGKVDEKL